MQHRLLTKTLLLFLITIYVAYALQSTTNSPKPKRALKKHPGFFRTLFSVVFEQYVDTKNTISNVSRLINDNFLPEDAALTQTTPSSNPNVSTTAAPFRITRTEFNRILSRNLRGLVRLFNIELQDALKASEGNYEQHKKNASLEVSKYL